MTWTKPGELFLAFGLFAVGAVVLISLVLSAPPFDVWLRAWVERNLSQATDHETQVSGSASVAIGFNFTIDLRDVRFVDDSFRLRQNRMNNT